MAMNFVYFRPYLHYQNTSIVRLVATAVIARLLGVVSYRIILFALLGL